MSYESLETSQASGAPKELYLFERGAKCWPYTSADEDTVHGAKTYLARTVSRSAFQRNDEAASSEVEVRVDRELGLVPQFLDGSSPEPVLVTIFRLHRDDAEAIVAFKGRIANATIEREEIVLVAQSPLGKDEKQIPRETILRTCPHDLYGPECRVDRELFKVETTISAVGVGGEANKYDISDTTNAPPFFDAGVIVKDATGQRGFIGRHQFNGRIWLLRPMPGLAVTDAVTLFAGCKRTVEVCRDKFDNVAQFGGFPRHPDRNPFVQIPADDILDP